jgi:hypothetical protein
MFGIVSEKVEEEAQRALILVAKVLQVMRCASLRTRASTRSTESRKRRQIWLEGAISAATQCGECAHARAARHRLTLASR